MSKVADTIGNTADVLSFVGIVAAIAFVAYCAVNVVVSDNKVNFCYVQQGECPTRNADGNQIYDKTGHPLQNKCYFVYGNREWAQDRMLATFNTVEEVTANAKQLGCDTIK